MDRETILYTNLMKIHLVRAELFNTETDRQTDRRMDRETILYTNFMKIHLVMAELFNTETDRQTDGWTERNPLHKFHENPPGQGRVV